MPNPPKTFHPVIPSRTHARKSPPFPHSIVFSSIPHILEKLGFFSPLNNPFVFARLALVSTFSFLLRESLSFYVYTIHHTHACFGVFFGGGGFGFSCVGCASIQLISVVGLGCGKRKKEREGWIMDNGKSIWGWGCFVVTKEPPTENRNVELLLDFF